MALDVIQVEGCYISSSLPKALFVPDPSPRSRSKRSDLHGTDALYFKPKARPKLKPTNYNSNEAPVEGRQHLAVQTDLYLEELCDVIEEVDAQCETDSFLESPLSPVFVPVKSGVDAETQIYPGELFDFAEDVEPILDVLVEESLELALLELNTEEKLSSLADLKKGYEEKISNELAEIQKLEENEHNQMKEKEARIKEHEDAILLEDEVQKKIIACIFSQNYLSDLVPDVYKKLENEGYFEMEDPEMQEIEDTFWPWLMDEVDSEIATLEASCQLLDTLIVDAVENISETSVNNTPSDVKTEENVSYKASSDISKTGDIEPK